MKPFDLAALKDLVREQSGPEAEEHVEKILDAVFQWLQLSALASESSVVKMAVPLAVEVIKPVLKPVVDQIDGQQG